MTASKTQTDSTKPAETPGETRLDSDVTKPSTTAPGDGPADTTDPNERAQSVPPIPGEEALAAGTVNVVKPVPKSAGRGGSKAKARVERYEALTPSGETVTIERNIETGESKQV